MLWGRILYIKWPEIFCLPLNCCQSAVFVNLLILQKNRMCSSVYKWRSCCNLSTEVKLISVILNPKMSWQIKQRNIQFSFVCLFQNIFPNNMTFNRWKPFFFLKKKDIHVRLVKYNFFLLILLFFYN